MGSDIVVAGVVVPGIVAAVVAALWNLASQRELRAIESRLRREEEAFRLAQSPRVRAAVALWVAFCELERSLRSLVTPFDALVPEDLPADERHRLAREAWERHEAEALAAMRSAFGALKKARDEAECLLTAPVFARFDALYRSCDAAQAEYWASRAGDFGRPERRRMRDEVERLLGEAAAQRPAVVEAIRSMIAAPSRA